VPQHDGHLLDPTKLATAESLHVVERHAGGICPWALVTEQSIDGALGVQEVPHRGAIGSAS
jgi:hypothetical protein